MRCALASLSWQTMNFLTVAERSSGGKMRVQLPLLTAAELSSPVVAAQMQPAVRSNGRSLVPAKSELRLWRITRRRWRAGRSVGT